MLSDAQNAMAKEILRQLFERGRGLQGWDQSGIEQAIMRGWDKWKQ